MTTDRLARLGAVAAVLWAAHDLGDHVIQTDEQAAGKAHADPMRALGPMLGHLGGYHAAQGAALGLTAALTGWRPSPGRVAAGMAFSALTHGFLDRRWPVAWLLEHTGSGRFARPLVRTHWSSDGYGRATAGRGVPRDIETTGPLPLHGMYLADQSCHHVALLVAAAIITGGR